MPSGDSFLPRIQSVFYAVFDETIGPKILYQVPEGLIATQGSAYGSSPSSPSPEPSAEPQTPNASGEFSFSSRASSTSLVSPSTDHGRRGRQFPSPSHNESLSGQQRTLFHFSEISMYVIPSRALSGRLVICSTKRHRIIGFPVELTGKYQRWYFRYNLCFVFERKADLSCYEPVVRKISRVLRNCEEESGFLSSPEKSHEVHGILEQLYEDLNSYSETSIAIDRFNSIELKIFPFYPNPPEVKDYMVPLALINISKRFEQNWDLTMIKVSRHIDGVNHVAKIAHLADSDIRLVRLAIAHLLYYQVIMTIDIFQYSNMYTLCKSIQWLADEVHVKDECGTYVAQNGSKRVPEWPELLHLYSRFKPGKTVYDWIKEYNVEPMGIDVRRFITFGVIKGFLRRVHRYPVYIKPERPVHEVEVEYPVPAHAPVIRKRSKSHSASAHTPFTQLPVGETLTRFPSERYGHQEVSPLDSYPHPSHAPATDLEAQERDRRAGIRPRRSSVAEKVLEQLRDRGIQKAAIGRSPRPVWGPQYQTTREGLDDLTALPPPFTQRPDFPRNSIAVTTASTSYATVTSISTSHRSPTGVVGTGRDARRTSMISPTGPPPSPVLPKTVLTQSRPRIMNRAGQPAIPLSSHSKMKAATPSYSHYSQESHQEASMTHAFLEGIKELCDGEHNTDDIGVRFGCGWPQLEEWLAEIGGGEGQGDLGNVVIIYR